MISVLRTVRDRRAGHPAQPAAIRAALARRLPAAATLLMALLLSACATLGSGDAARYEALRNAIRDGDYQRANELIRANPDVLDDRRAVSMAISLGSPDAVARFASQAGANSALDLDGTSPLLRSVTAAPPAMREQIVVVLLKLGADPRQADKNGTDAATLAKRRGERRLVALMNDALGIRSDQLASDGPPPTARWMPAPEHFAAQRAAAARKSKSAARRPADNPATRLVKAAPSLPASSLPHALFADLWIAAPADLQRAEEVAGLRFHADGTGELLRVGTQRAGPLQRQPDAFVAWIYEAERFAFFVSSPLFTARCESQSLQAARVEFQCTDFAPIPDSEVSIAQPLVARVAMSQDMARAMTTGQPQGAALIAGATVRATLHAAPPGLCTLRTRQFRAPKDTRLEPAPGDWYVLDQRTGITRSSLSGEACLQDEARRAALAQCARDGGRCRSVGGCRAGQASAAASLHGAGWSWVACAADAEAAKQAALARCRAEAGCDCQLVALGGNNLNTLRGAVCQAPVPKRLQVSRAP